jgi:NAD(P)-dependent dehydrogenase (short-subunit alcohol dehydrogenase family)
MNTNTKKLDGKVAVVTGASKGIGAGIAKHLAAEGAAVVVNYASSKEGADLVVEEITKRGGKAIAVQADVAKKKISSAYLLRRKKHSSGSIFSLTTPACIDSIRSKR